MDNWDIIEPKKGDEQEETESTQPKERGLKRKLSKIMRSGDSKKKGKSATTPSEGVKKEKI